MANASKTILMTINTSWNIVNFRSPLIQALQEAGYRVISAAPDDAHTPALRALVAEHYSLPMQNDGTSMLQDARLFWRYVQLLRRTRPDAILAYTIKPNIYASFAARLLGIPVINNVSGLGTVFIKQNWLTKVACSLYRAAFSSSAHVFFQNKADRQIFIDRSLVNAEKTSVIPGSGIDLQAFKPVARATKAAQAACDFVLIARMLRDKGVQEFVDAARMVKQQHPDCHFRLVGPLGVQNKTAITQTQMQQWVDEGVVEYCGEQGDIQAVMAQHDCVVLPSYREGMSRVLLEAAAMGVPMITSDVPGCRDVADHGENGFLCDVRNASDLAKQLMAFIALHADAKQLMGHKSRIIAEQRFNQARVHRAYVQQLQRCQSAPWTA
jgi:glycosyltransferase involved in cell wall biosynthesis